MSTIRVDNFGPSAGGTTYSARGIAKAWVNFNGTGTIAARDSENVSSLTDNGTGDYTVNINNDMADGNYAMASAGGGTAGNFNTSVSVGNFLAAPTGSAIRVVSLYGTSQSDCGQANVAILGDLA